MLGRHPRMSVAIGLLCRGGQEGKHGLDVPALCAALRRLELGIVPHQHDVPVAFLALRKLDGLHDDAGLLQATFFVHLPLGLNSP